MGSLKKEAETEVSSFPLEKTVCMNMAIKIAADVKYAECYPSFQQY